MSLATISTLLFLLNCVIHINVKIIVLILYIKLYILLFLLDVNIMNIFYITT